ncbi:MAG: DnaJ domain-containing protein [Cyanobacteriota bacterium]|nr:DnaJ domain-containing protein [Cyanobacteriota bacterium]
MGFDPRRWRPPTAGSGPTVTTNVEALLAENDALRREVRALRRQLEQHSHDHGVNAGQVERWSEALARHPQWGLLRLGPPGGLRGVIEAQRRRWWNPQLELEQELERRCPGLGLELAEALRGRHSRGRWAVRAAFALYGPRAIEWLNEAPLRVVEELLQRVERLEGGRQRRQGTRTANHSTTAAGRPDPRLQALNLLGLEPGAPTAAIKAAYRRLAKRHHPDLGGDHAAFQQLEAAYRLLINL